MENVPMTFLNTEIIKQINFKYKMRRKKGNYEGISQ